MNEAEFVKPAIPVRTHEFERCPILHWGLSLWNRTWEAHISIFFLVVVVLGRSLKFFFLWRHNMHTKKKEKENTQFPKYRVLMKCHKMYRYL